MIDQFQLQYEISPIFLVGGIAAQMPGGVAPISSFLQASSYPTGILSNSDDIGLDDYFAHFKVIPGGTLANNQIGQYTFANQFVAANAIIFQPLNISLLMIAPARGSGAYLQKLAIMTALQSTIQQHVNLGGLFNVATPAFLYTNCLLLPIRDVTGGGQDQVQVEWQWDFTQPLVTLAEAQAAMNSQMTKWTNGVPQGGDPPSPSGLNPAVGQPPSGVGQSIIPAAGTLVGGSAAGAGR